MPKSLSELLLEQFDKYDREKYHWNLPKGCPITVPDGSGYRRNVYLKEHLKDEFKKGDDEKFLGLAYWIINSWGGIRGFKWSDKNDERLKAFREKLNDPKKLNSEKLNKTEYSVIPSLSKVASFYRPQDFVIYDSRVTFSLNWLIFKNKIESKFFPQLPSRNTKLVNIKQKDIFLKSGRKVEYYPKNEAYLEYCKLLKETAKMGGKGIKNYDLEMFLFTIADSDIVDDIERWKK